jgi:hypothetical protein
VQALVDNAAHANPLQLPQRLHLMLPQRPGPSGAWRPSRRAALPTN